jgi:hypothetical protein
MAGSTYDRVDRASEIATIGMGSRTRGSYTQIDSNALKSSGPQSLTANNSQRKGSIDVVEEYAAYGGADKYLISMRDDFIWIAGESDYQDTYYTGFTGAGYADTENVATLDKLGRKISRDVLYMYLKRATIVPVGLPPTTNPSEFSTDAAKQAGFLNHEKFFQYTTNFEYYGEKGGISNPGADSDAQSNTIDWVYIGSINQNDAESSARGSWNTLRETYYPFDSAYPSYFAGAIGASRDTPDPDNWNRGLWGGQALRFVLSFSKCHIKIQSTSATTFDTPISVDAPLVGSPAGQPESCFNLTLLTSRTTGAFLYEYCGPLKSTAMLLDGSNTGTLTFLGEDWGAGGSIHAGFTAGMPAILDGLITKSDGESTSYAEFDEGGWYRINTALAIRFDTEEVSLGRANAYLDYYTGYLYEKVEQDPIPREYKTKMQATPRLNPKLMSAVSGKRVASNSTPSTSEVSTATTTSDMGSSY